MFDAAIIGTGPAGISAALNLKIHQKDFIWLGAASLSDKIVKAEKISNYPGLPDVSGPQLTEAFLSQTRAMGIEITEKMVNSIMPMGDHYALLAGADFYEARVIILTTGVLARAAQPGESELLGRGVSYCATCDGGLYRGKTIAVISNAARFEHEVKFLAELAETVYFYPTYSGAGDIAPNVVKNGDRVTAVLGEERVAGVRLRSGADQPVDGVFCLRDQIVMSSLLAGLETEDGHIKVDRAMATNLPGIFAAGDCTGRPYQYAKAVGEGNVAAHSAIEYLDA
ncbi:MAG: NAD(P)/FAD-dependent oxidoreductase [Lachnospiraceae bacterium]|nr:NAD(P)/FAD-dependent oxidoreductase [Lachnospiraceae bacterium]